MGKEIIKKKISTQSIQSRAILVKINKILSRSEAKIRFILENCKTQIFIALCKILDEMDEFIILDVDFLKINNININLGKYVN